MNESQKRDWDYYKQIVWKEVPIVSLITQKCGCVLKRVESKQWNYPTFYAIKLCPEKNNCQLKHRVIGREVWDFYEEFKNLDMEASFGITDKEANEILREWWLLDE